MPATIIQRLAPLKNLGVFKDSKVADAQTCLQYNLIYGFNGTGKTTLSRVFGSLEAGALRPELPEGGTFEVQLSDGSIIKSTGELNALQGRLLVFNVDFVEESFKWKEGTARPVFYLGREQANLADQLAKTSGELKALAEPAKSAEALRVAKEKAFAQLKRDAARLIAEQLNLGRLYDAAKLATDYGIDTYTDDKLLSERRRVDLRAAIAQVSPLAKLPLLAKPELVLVNLLHVTNKIAPITVGSIALEDLQGHESMRDWIATGLAYHEKNSLEKCLFCANDVTAMRLEHLRQSIDDKFDQLKRDTKEAQTSAVALQMECKSLAGALPSSNDISQSFRTEYLALSKALGDALGNADRTVSAALALLNEKLASPNLSAPVEFLTSTDECAKIEAEIRENLDAINKLLTKHNAESDNFAEAKHTAAKNLKEHYLAEGQKGYTEANDEVKVAKKAVDGLEAEINVLKDREIELRKAVRQHGPAATIINKLIHSYLGRKEIALVPSDDGYRLDRNGKPVNGSLSEGEKTAIALCYFLSTLEAEGRKRKDLIVVLDDPVSSLDTKAMNYAFSIVKSSLGEAGQLFLLTHNLNFMNEAKKWLKTKTQKEAAKQGKLGTATLLFLDAIQTGDEKTRVSVLKELPKYIRDYESEYHYLFNLVLRFHTSPEEHSEYFYVIPNALRKLLDVFLAFKLPGPDGLTSKVETILKLEHGLDAGRTRALERLAQVESHADSLDDLVTFSSMTVEEAKEAAASLLALMEALDVEHFTRMKSICKPA
ncbi:AAA family ATPase (plasmid) [Cupriavidus basilensis]